MFIFTCQMTKSIRHLQNVNWLSNATTLNFFKKIPRKLLDKNLLHNNYKSVI